MNRAPAATLWRSSNPHAGASYEPDNGAEPRRREPRGDEMSAGGEARTRTLDNRAECIRREIRDNEVSALTDPAQPVVSDDPGPARHAVESSVCTGHLYGDRVVVDRQHAGSAERGRRDRQYAGPSANIDHARPGSRVPAHGFEAQLRAGVLAAAERLPRIHPENRPR
jgi:hypothetical protein